MTDYDNAESRTNVTPLINEEVLNEIIKEVPLQSTVLPLMRRLPNASKKQVRIPVLNSLATAYFLTGEGGDGTGTSYQRGLKKTTKIEWANKYVYIEEIAAIVPVSQAVLDDSDYDIWAEVKPAIVEAISAEIDDAILFGTAKPSTWPDAIMTGVASASATVEEGSIDVDLYDDLYGVNGVMDKIRKCGYFPNGFVTGMGMEAKLDGLRDKNGVPIFSNFQNQEGQYRLKGKPVITDLLGNMDANSDDVLMIAGAWNKAVYSIRQDMTFDVSKDAAIFNDSGTLVYNLWQQDMVGLRCTMRLGWQLPNPVNRIQSTAGSRYPFAALIPASA